MAKILVTPGCKDRLSGTIGRLIAASWHDCPSATETDLIEAAMKTALAIEERLTKEMQIEPSDSQARF